MKKNCLNAKLKTTSLLNSTQWKKGKIICAFAYTVRNNDFGKTLKPSLWSTTINVTITNMASTFREFFLTDPTLDSDKKMVSLTKTTTRL